MSPTRKEGGVPFAWSRITDFAELTKPELTLLSVLTALGGGYLGTRAGGDPARLAAVFIGTFLVGGGAGALNMRLEHAFDAAMRRTAARPIPSGRVTPTEAGSFGLILSAAGVAILSLWGSTTAGVLAIVTLATYLAAYTPLKRITPFATVVGAVPGALPPVIGWAGVTGNAPLGAWSLFAILFFWQIPHFLSLSWIHRADYERGGYRMLTVLDTEGRVTARQIGIHSFALIPASLLPVYLGILGGSYFAGAALLSSLFFAVGLWNTRPLTDRSARRIFLASLAFLPILMLLMMLDGW